MIVTAAMKRKKDLDLVLRSLNYEFVCESGPAFTSTSPGRWRKLGCFYLKREFCLFVSPPSLGRSDRLDTR